MNDAHFPTFYRFARFLRQFWHVITPVVLILLAPFALLFYLEWQKEREQQITEAVESDLNRLAERIREYEQRHGEWPKTLESISGGISLQDPFSPSDSNYVYLNLNDGRYVGLHSVGPDRVDHLGFNDTTVTIQPPDYYGTFFPNRIMSWTRDDPDNGIPHYMEALILRRELLDDNSFGLAVEQAQLVNELGLEGTEKALLAYANGTITAASPGFQQIIEALNRGMQPSLEPLHEAMDALEPMYAAIHKGASAPEASVEYPPEVRSTYVTVPYYYHVNGLLHLAAARARQLSSDGQLRKSIQRQLDLIEFSVEGVPAELSLMSAISCLRGIDVSTKGLRSSIRSEDIEGIDLQNIISAVQDVPPLDRLIHETLRNDVQRTVNDLRSKNWNNLEDEYRFSEKTYLEQLEYKTKFLLGRNGAIETFKQRSDTALDAWPLPYAEAKQVFESLQPIDIGGITITFSYFERLRKLAAISQSNLNSLLLQAALELHHRQHGAYPESLSALEDILGEIPTDPFTPGQPYQYRPVQATYMLYSIGPDGADNRGQIEYDDTYVGTGTGDIIFSATATPRAGTDGLSLFGNSQLPINQQSVKEDTATP